MITQILFYFLSIAAVVSAILMVFSKNPVHSILYLIGTLFSIAGHYFLMNAQFLGVVHLIVYAGAIMVLFLYVIMMLNLNEEVEPAITSLQKIAGVISSGLLSLVLIASMRRAELETMNTADAQIGYVETLGEILFNDFLLPFELSSLLILAAMIGAVFLSRKEKTA